MAIELQRNPHVDRNHVAGGKTLLCISSMFQSSLRATLALSTSAAAIAWAVAVEQSALVRITVMPGTTLLLRGGD